MTPRSITLGLIEGAIERVEQTKTHVFTREKPFQWAGRAEPSEPDAQAQMRDKAQSEVRERPTLSAVNFCLSSAAALLKICHSLIDHEGPQSPQERERLWKQLASETKVAGGAAYRAALVLAEPADADQQVPWLSTTTQAESDEHQKREAILMQSELYRHWARIKAHGVTAQQFAQFLRPMIDTAGVCVTYLYRDQDGVERIYNHVDGDGPLNPMVNAIEAGSLSLEDALKFALNEQGRRWVEKTFAVTHGVTRLPG